MIDGKSIAVVVPAYNEEKQIARVVTTLPDFVDRIVVVDDGSTDGTAELVRTLQSQPGLIARLEFLQTPVNSGVGSAIAKGYRYCRDQGIQVTAVMDGDGQMDPSELARIVAPVVRGIADYSKGNRLLNETSWKDIPRVRFIGNAVLSFLTKIVSGYWGVVDSQTGYTAISLRALSALDLDRLYCQYGVYNDILTKLNIGQFTIAQMAIRPVYNVGETSTMRTGVVMFTIPCLFVRLFFHRLFYKYVVRDFHPLVFCYVVGLAFLFSGLIGGVTIFVIDLLQTLQGIASVSVSVGWMLLYAILVLAGLNLVLFGMWMDRDENKALQITLSPEAADALTQQGPSRP